MTNMERWENFFKRKGWKYKKVTGQWGTSWLIKTYHNAQRCHIFVNETQLKYSFYKGYMTGRGSNKSFHRGRATQFCLSIRAGNLNIFHKAHNRNHVVNLATGGPGVLINSMNQVIRQPAKEKVKYDPWDREEYGREPKYKVSKEARNKMVQSLQFFLQLNKLNADPINQETLLNACYPSAKNFPIKHWHKISHILRKPNLGFNDIVKQIFKHKSKIITKKLMDETANKLGNPADIIEIGYMLKPFLNRGEMEQLVQIPHLTTFSVGGLRVRDCRKFFRKLTSKQILHLFNQEYRSWEVGDTLRQFAEFPDKLIIPDKIQNWKFVHDEFTRQYRRLEQEDYQFTVKPALKDIHGVEVDGETIVVPQSRHELIDWGTKMHNCIAGYHDSFEKGHTVLLGVKERDQLKYNIEINGGKIRQFMADYNARAPQDVIAKYEKILKQYKLVRG